MNNIQPIFKALEGIKYGSIAIELPNGKIEEFHSQNKFPKAHIRIKDLKMIDQCLIGGDVALGESYIRDEWDSKNLPDLILFFAKNSHCLEDFFHAHKIKMLLLYIQALFRENSKKGSKKNIEFHYDLGNDFYKLWLDKTMTYSSGIFKNDNDSLFDSQINKYNRILDKFDKNSKILEIGCGWGGFANEAIKRDHQVSGLTLSNEQAKYAKELLQDKAQIKIQDYRDEENKYDFITSIEMFEAVGRKYWNTYFKTIRNSLKQGGKAVIQTITIDDEVSKKYKNRVDFIQKYIFPGGVLPSKEEFAKLAIKNNLEVKDQFDFGLSYQKTLLCWLDDFNKVHKQIIDLGFNQKFIRKWQFYLAYCAAGFGAKRCDVVQFELQ